MTPTPTPVPITASLLRGVADLEQTERGLRLHRLPTWARATYADDLLLAMQAQPAGARIVFGTEATSLELVCHSTRTTYPGLERPRGTVDVLVDGVLAARDTLTGGDVTEIDLATGRATLLPGPPHTTTVTGLAPGPKRVEIWLPHNEAVELVALRCDAPVEPEPQTAPLWVHHGSSISQGSNAQHPSETWPAVAARRARLDLHNLGFGGSAMVDPFVARVIRDRPADLITLELGINVVNADAMRLRAFVPAVHGFLDTIRDGHPRTPVVLVSPLWCGIHETTPGPGAFDPESFGTEQVRFIATGRPDGVASGQLTLEVVRRELAALVARRGDERLRYLDGTELYGAADAAALPLPDGLHPAPAAHRLIGQRFAAQALTASGG